MTRQTSNLRLSSKTLPELVSRIGTVFGKQIQLDIQPVSQVGTLPAPDFLVKVTWMNQTFEFAAAARATNVPRIFDDALRQSRRFASQLGLFPLIIVPYLSENRIERLLDENVSGLDLCGNGLITIPGRVYLQRTGQPNLFRESRPARFAYRGIASLVPRAFLRQPTYASVGEIIEEITKTGASISWPTVSRALTRMVDDVIVDRAFNQITLLKPDKLLDTLLQSYRPPLADQIEKAKCSLPLPELFNKVSQQQIPPPTSDGNVSLPRLVLSGASSQDRYVAGLRADATVLYTDNLGELRKSLDGFWQPTDRYANVTVIETQDPTPFFDARRDKTGVLVASPVQTFLELGAEGEKRDFAMAQSVRARILEELKCFVQNHRATV